MAKKKTTKKSKSLSTSQQIGIGVALTTAAVGAAAGYFLYGSKNAKQNRNKVKSWVLMAKGEVLEALEDAQEMTKEQYEALVDEVAAAYSTVQAATKGDVAAFTKEMKQHWKQIEKEAGVVGKAAKKVVKRATAKKPAKKTAKKVAKKTTKKSTKKVTKKASKK